MRDMPSSCSDSHNHVFVVDDDEAVRDAIGLLLDTQDIPHTTFANAADFLGYFSNELRGCLVLDIRMPGMSGLELQEHLLELGNKTPIIFITGHGDIPMAVEAMKKGAVDFIRKPFHDQELLDCIDEALDLESSQQTRETMLQTTREKFDSLTPREREVFSRVTQGQANKVIAIELGISERTVEIHRSHVMHKTTARTLADLVRMKIRLEQANA